MKRTLIDQFVELGPLAMVGMVLGGLLLSFWLFRIIRRQRHSWPFLVAALLLGLGGYAFSDQWFIKRNLALRDMEQVRADCEELLEHYRPEPRRELVSLKPQEIPKSLQAIGGTQVRVTFDRVEIVVTPPHYGWLLLYDPKKTFVHQERDRLRPMWHRAFYYFDAPIECPF